MHWAGVWDTSNYSPADPDNKTFVRWLVSGSETAVDGIDDAGTPPDNDTVTGDVLIFENVKNESGVIVPDPDGAGSVKVPKVEVATSTAGNKSYYAYWVDDEGVKSDMAWNENVAASTSTTDQERAQARLLGSDPGPNYWLGAVTGALGPYRDPNDDGSASDAIGGVTGLPTGFPKDEMEKVVSLADVPLAAAGGEPHRNWLKIQRHSMSFNNRGVLADVKQGGLRRDLSLAFEMDGDADVTASEQPALFNQQVGEFVGGTDRLAAPSVAAGMGGVKERFLYRDYHDSGTPFSNDIQDEIYMGHQTVVRGPNWWAVRDYYNLYKRLRADGANYVFDARAYYPNASVGDASYHYGSMHGVHNARTWDAETYVNRWGTTRYIYKPARATYAPILLGQSAVFSVLATNSDGTEADLSLGVDPFFFLWNPYNRKLQVSNYAAVLTTWPGTITFEVDRANGDGSTTTTRIGPATVSKFFEKQSVINEGGEGRFVDLSYHLATPLTMDPGEIVVLSPSSTRNLARANQLHDELFPGTNTDNASGAILKEMPVVVVKIGDNPNTDEVETEYEIIEWDPVKLNLATDTVRFLHTTQYLSNYQGAKDTNMSEHCWTHISMPPPGTLPINAWKDGQRGEHLQQIGGNAAGDRVEPWPELFRPGTHARSGGTLPPFSGSAAANTMVNTKRFFGMGANLLKPVAHERRDENGDVVNANTIENFTQFNPYRMAGYSDMWRPCLPNESYTGISDPGDIDVLLYDAGIQWPASQPGNGFFGLSYTQNGLTHVPMSNIPSSPMISLVDLNHANFGVGYWHPFHSVGNSRASVHVSPLSPYGARPAPSYMGTATSSDSNWLLNDALFDRYFLSGIVPEYSIGSGGYNATGSLGDTLHRFYGINPSDTAQSVAPDTAQASPVMEAYVPAGKTAEEIVIELTPTSTNHDVYKKIAAYCLQKGSFNVNCTDANAWGRFLRRSLDGVSIKFTDGSADSRGGYIGFPSSSSPTPTVGTSARQTWSGWSRLVLRGQINNLANNFALQVKKRGPFMSVSDFVNRKVGGSTVTGAHYKGAVQAAVDTMDLNDKVEQDVYTPVLLPGTSPPSPNYSNTNYFATTGGSNRRSTDGIAGSNTQANVLRALAPRLSARSDTFRIRAYGEVRDSSDNIIAMAMCEALVQRLPEYVDPDTNEDYNEPWDEYDPDAPVNETLNATNQKYGRRFEIRSFRWLDESEI